MCIICLCVHSVVISLYRQLCILFSFCFAENMIYIKDAVGMWGMWSIWKAFIDNWSYRSNVAVNPHAFIFNEYLKVTFMRKLSQACYWFNNLGNVTIVSLCFELSLWMFLKISLFICVLHLFSDNSINIYFCCISTRKILMLVL